MKKKILIAPSIFASIDPGPLEKLRKNNFEVIKNPFGKKLTAQELADLLPGVQGIIAGLETLDRQVLENSELEVISRCGAGVSNIDLDVAKELGIKVLSTPDAPTNAVAELVVGAMLCLIRNVTQMNSDLHNKKWSKKIGMQIENSTMAIIGFGRIGRRVAELLKPFKANIIAVDPDFKGPKEGISVLSLNDALPQSDIITIHASGDEAILSAKEFALMKKGVFLMNCARGKAIDEKELIRALDNGQVLGAWLDCFQDEPYSGALTRYPQVILTPHIGSYTVECRRQMEMEAVDNLIAGFSQSEYKEQKSCV